MLIKSVFKYISILCPHSKDAGSVVAATAQGYA